MRFTFAAVCAATVTLACVHPAPRAAAASRDEVPVIGGPCEGCEAVFDGLPQRIPSVARIASRGEPGTALRIEGTVRDAEGRPAPGMIVYAYHTNADGVYPRGPASWSPTARRHGRLRGWAMSDSLGRYRFDTIRPASYPSRTLPAHVHMHVIEPGCCTYWIDDVLFDDDPLLTADRRRAMSHGRGGPGIAVPRRDATGAWVVTRDIVLGAGVPGYRERGDVER